jgi:tetratricopeptide (TPR) repeat protein
MKAFNSQRFRVPGLLIAVILGAAMLPCSLSAATTVMEHITIDSNPLAVRFPVPESTPVKVIQVEKNELVVALKNVDLSRSFKVQGKKPSTIRDVAIETLQGNVVAVVVTSKIPFLHVRSGYDSSSSSFMVMLEKKPESAPPQAPAVPDAATSPPAEKSVAAEVKAPEPASLPQPEPEKAPQPTEVPKPAPAPEENSTEPKAGTVDKKSAGIPDPPVYVPPQRETSRFKGDISDLVRIVEDTGCESQQVGNAVMLLQKRQYADAFKILDQYLAQESFACLEEAYYLKAFAFYRQVKKEDFAQLMKAETYFQEALVSYPASVYVPFGYSGIGMIQKNLANVSAAEGYFNIVKQGFLAYSGMPEVLYHLAEIYVQKGYLDKALRYYQQVFEDTVYNNYIGDAGIGYGKALFQKKQYLNTLSVLNYVVSSEPKKIYESSELLLHIGNANFEVGQSRAAREALTRVMNLFPKIENPDVILSKVGDTYGMENNQERAIKVYELVREKYPDTQGFIASSIGIARYLKTDEEKIEIYKMVKNKFPENTYARIAMMRLAEIYQANGQYNECINQILELLSTQPRGLRYEAVKLMQKAYEALFQKQLKSGEFTGVLNRYELDHQRIDRMGSRQLSFTVGLAYLEAKLYEEAFNHLLTAYKLYKRSERSPALLFGLGLAMDESGRDDDAVRMFDALAARFEKDKNRVEALLRAGTIYLDKKNYKQASSKFDEAVRVSRKPLDRGRILMQHAAVFESKNDMQTASRLHEKAVKELALASGENYTVLTQAYKALGGNYMKLKLFVDAADAYEKALSFSDDDGEKANLGFLLGDAYQKGNILPKAKAAYEQVVLSYDSVWARLARKRLDILELADTVQNS